MNEVDSLQGLIGKARRERATSIRQLAMQAKAAGYKIVGTTLNAIESGSYKSTPSDDTIRAIAWLAGVGEETAFMAAGRRVPGPPFAAELPPGVDDLSPKEREAVIGLLRVLVAQRQELDNEDTSTQDTTRNPTLDGEAGLGGAPMIAAPRQQPDPSPRRAGPKVVPLDERERREYERKHTSPNTPQHQD